MPTVDTLQVELKIPRKPEFLKLARATAWALAAQLDFLVVQADDVKLAVGEACTNAVEHVPEDQSEAILVRFEVDPQRLTVEVVDHGPGFDITQPGTGEENDRGLGLVVIRSVMDMPRLPNSSSNWYVSI